MKQAIAIFVCSIVLVGFIIFTCDETATEYEVETTQTEETIGTVIETKTMYKIEEPSIVTETTTEEITTVEETTKTEETITVEETTTENETTTIEEITEVVATETEAENLSISDADCTRLEKIAYAEARGEGVQAMALVMLVILNRVESEIFPNTIEGVIMQSGQFSPVSSGSYAKAVPNESTHEALELVLSGWDESQGALYFDSYTGNSWHMRNLTYLFTYGKIRFFK